MADTQNKESADDVAPQNDEELTAVVQRFDQMNLKKDLLTGIHSYGFERPSTIQSVRFSGICMTNVITHYFREALCRLLEAGT